MSTEASNPTTNIQPDGDFVEGNKIEGDQYNIYGLSVKQVAILVAELRRVDQPTVWNGRIPYLGLSAFQESDAEFFFGRENLVDDLLGRLQQSHFITIAGPSGSGKSSVARAGLFHALRRGRLSKSDQWLLATMLPGNHPLESLAVAIERLTKVAGSADSLRHKGVENPHALHQQAEILLTDDPSQRLVLLVDQFEEVFTQTKNGAEQAAFIQLLTHAAKTEGSRLTILLSLRSDFISHCARYPALRELLNQQFMLVGGMETHDLAKAITLPALEVGAKIDHALVSRIMADMKGEPGVLPLMSFALRDLFEAEKTAVGKPMDLTLAEYVQRGGIEKALERHANAVFADFSAEQQALARGVFSKLIEVEGRVDTRRTAVFSELVPAGQDPQAVRVVVDQLAKARLLTTSGDKDQASDRATTVTVAHEKLIDAWPWLRQLVDDNREAIALQNQIANDAKAWVERQDAGYLYRGGRLAQVEEKLQELEANLDELSQQFIQASVAARVRVEAEAADLQTQKRVGRILRWATAVGGVLLVVAVVLAFQASNNAEVAAIREAEAIVARGTSEANANSAFIARQTSDANAALAATSEAEARLAQATSDVNAELASTREVEARVAEAGAVNARATAEVSEAEARLAQATSEANAALAATSEAQALIARSTAQASEAEARASDVQVQQLKNVIQASQLAFASQAELTNNPERALLLAITGLRTNLQADTRLQLAESLQTSYRTTLYGHDNAVTSAVFSPDGETILTAGDDGTARLWDRQGLELVILRGHEGSIGSAVFSPDGETILTAGDDGTVRLWDRVGNELVVLQGHQGLARSAVFSPDGETILTASNDGTARLWDRQNNLLAILNVSEGPIWSATFSPDGETFLTAHSDGTARLWDNQGNPLAILRGHEVLVSSVVFSPDGQMILTASWWDRTARLWDKQGNLLAILQGHEDEVHSAVFSPNGQIILTSSDDRTIRLWNQQGDSVAVFRGYSDWVESAIFSPDGQIILSASKDGTVWLWNLYGETIVLSGHEDMISSAVFSPNEETILTSGHDGTARLWNQQGTEVVVLHGHDATVSSAVFSPDGESILTASWDGTARLWNPHGEEIMVLDRQDYGIVSAIFSPDGEAILTINDNGTAELWNRQGEGLAILHGHEDDINSAVFSSDGETILTSSDDGTARLWNRQGAELVVLRGHGYWVNSATFSPDGQTILTASNDTTARLWNQKGDTLAIFIGHEGPVSSAIFSSDGETILTASNDGTARLWNRQGEQLATLRGHTSWVGKAMFSPDEQTILTSSGDRTARLWDTQGNALAVLRGHEDFVTLARFSSDGQMILTASHDSTVRLWPNHYTVDYMLQQAYWRTNRSFTQAECQQYFRDDLLACPRTKKELFAPLVDYLSPEQQEEWANLP